MTESLSCFCGFSRIVACSSRGETKNCRAHGAGINHVVVT